MAGFRVDRVDGGFMIRELHSNRDKRKLAVVGFNEGEDLTDIENAVRGFLKHINDRYRKNSS